MRRLKTVSVILFICSLILLGINIFREKVVTDQTGPVFQMESELIEVSVKDGEEALLRGLSAQDAADGDVTDSVIVESFSPFTGTGHRIVTYAAFDSDNHVTHVKRELAYTDYEPPKFHLEKPLSFAMNATNLLDGITAQDCIDGDITRSVRMISDQDIDTAHVGEYSARLKVTNSAGGVSYLPVTIEIYDASVRYRLPKLNLTDNVVYVEKGSSFNPEEYLKSIELRGTDYYMTEDSGTYGDPSGAAGTEKTIGYDRVEIDDEVDTDVSGYYEVTYSFEDTEADAGTGKARLYVVVTEGRAGANE